MSNMIYPGNGATLKTETFFVDGVKFDICEVHPSHYEYLSKLTAKGSSKPSARFFLAVEDSHVVRYNHAEFYFQQTGECRYDFFCMGRAECKGLISMFEKEVDLINSANPKTDEAAKRLQGRKDRINKLFGTNY